MLVTASVYYRVSLSGRILCLLAHGNLILDTTNVYVSSITSFGSGISIGPLGATQSEFDLVENIFVAYVCLCGIPMMSRCRRFTFDTFVLSDISVIGPRNAAIIQAVSSPTAGSGLVRNVTFTRFEVDQTRIPIAIDQMIIFRVLSSTISSHWRLIV